MKRTFVLLLVAVCLQTTLHAWELPKRDVRAVWLTTAWALDWPAVRVPAPIICEEDGVTILNEVARETVRNQQKNQLLGILNNLEEANFNTIYFQVRAMSDAFYKSRLAQPEPWSQWISSERGADPGWSPLGFLVEHAHARGIEVHAWLNPYRYSTDPNWDWSSDLPNDYENTHPEWLLDYDIRVANDGTRTRPVILNPGIPAVRQRIADIVEDIITHYNVDGIVFDDYFYVSNTGTRDQAQFIAHNPNNFENIEDWRIDNINQMVRDVQARINKVRPEVVWGISPAGVALGTGLTHIAHSYGIRPCPSGQDWQRAQLSASPVAWLYDGSIDFISPQIYWDIRDGGNPSPSFRLVNDWWAEISNHFGRHHFSSNTSHVAGRTSEPRFSTPEILNQLQLTRDADRSGTAGTVHFRFGSYLPTTFDAFLEAPFQFPALTAIYGWKPAPIQDLVTNLNVSGQEVTWNHTRVGVPYVRFAIYAVPIANRDDARVFASPRYLQGVSYTTSFVLRDGINASTHRIAVAVYDRFGNLFPPRVYGESVATVPQAVLTFPTDGQTDVPIPGAAPLLQQRSGATSIFTWDATGADFYVWQIAEDRAFERPIASRETTVPNFSLALQTNIRPNTTYYWRVKSMKANAPVSVSEVRSFSGTTTPQFRVIAPARGAFDQSLTPTITWTNLGAGVNYTLEISKFINFDEIIHTVNTTATSFAIPSGILEQSNTYYVRVRATHQGRPLRTEFTYFSTPIADPLPFPVPTIISPADGDTIFGTDIEVVWEQQRSRGFIVHLSSAPNFPTRPPGRSEEVVGGLVYRVTYENLSEGIWYMRLRAFTDDEGSTGWSDTIMVHLLAEPPVSVPEINVSEFFSFVYRVSDGVSNLVINQPENNTVTVEIYSLTGSLISRQVHGLLGTGMHTLTLDMMSYARGVYLVRVNSGNDTKTLKVHR